MLWRNVNGMMSNGGNGEGGDVEGYDTMLK
jgi:hypothetical protein